MAKSWEDEIAKINYSVYKDYKNYAGTWRTNALKMEDARFGKQFSAQEEKQLLAFRQAPIPISVSTAIADTADALMMSSRPTVKVAPILNPFDDEKNKVSKNVSQLYNYLVQKSWYDSLGGLQYDRAIRDYTNTGHGLLYVVPRNEFGEFAVDVKHISWRYYYADPDSKDPLYRDMDNMIYAMSISKKAAYRFAKGITPDLEMKEFEEEFCKNGYAETGDSEDTKYGGASSTKDKVLFIQRMSLEETDVFMVIPTDPNINKNYGVEFKTYQELTPELIALEKSGKVKFEKRRKFHLTEYTSIGSKGYKIIYPVSQYNIIPLVYDHRDTPYPYGLIYRLYPLQRAMNKFLMSSILNMSIMNNTKILAEENSIINEQKFVQDSSMPGAIIKYRLPVPGYSQAPQIIQPTPMSEAWLTMPKYLTQMMEYVSGIFGTMMGDPSGTPNVFSTVAALQNAGGIKIKRRMAHIDASLSVVGGVIGEFYKHYAPINGFTSQVNATGEEEFKVYNKMDIQDDISEQGEVKKKLTIDPNTDLSMGFKEIRFTSEGSNGYETATEASALTLLATQLSQPALIPAILERFNIKDVDKIVQNLDSGQRLQQENAQLQQAIKEMESRTQILQNQIFQQAKAVEAQKVKGQLGLEVQKFKDNPTEYIKGMQTPQNAAMTNQEQMPMEGQEQIM